MNDIPLTIEQLFRKYGKPNPAPNVGQRVLIERGGKTDEAALALGEVISKGVGGVRQESHLVVKETQVHFADGRVTTPHRSPAIFPLHHFAKSIQERLAERATRLATVSSEYRRWAEVPNE